MSAVDEGVASSIGSLDGAAADEAEAAETGVSADEVWARMTPEALSPLRPNAARTAAEASVPAEKLRDDGRVRRLALWALRWGRYRWEDEVRPAGRRGRPPKASASDSREEVAKVALLYVKYLLQYNLCSSECLWPIYEPFLTAMHHHKNLRPVISDILCAVTDARHVTPWRVNVVAKMAASYYRGTNTKDWRGVVNLAHRFRFFKPELIPASLQKLKCTHETSSGSSDSLGYMFESVWKDRTPMDSQFDDLGPESRLDFDGNRVFKGVGADYDGQEEAEPAAKRRRRLREGPRTRASLRSILGGEQPNPIQEQLAKKIKRKGGEDSATAPWPLGKCQKVDDVYNNLSRLVMPSRTLSLLGNRGTFFLLTVNHDRDLTRKRLAVSLHYVLYNEFFAAEGGAHGRSLERKSFLLQRVARLQDFFQQGIPVVARFLAEFLADWDGKTLFLDVIKLLPYIQLTDFQELHDCIILPLRKLFNSTFSPMERVLVLFYLHKLLLHWIGVEYERVVRLREGRGGPGAFGRADTTGSGIEHAELTAAAIGDASRAPLSAVAGLMAQWTAMAQLGLLKAFVGVTGGVKPWIDRDEELELEGRRADQAVYLNEVLTMFQITSRLLVKKDIPLRPDLPLPFLYFALFSRSPIFLSRALDLISATKHENIPMCKRHLRRLEQDLDAVGAEDEREVVAAQLEEDAEKMLNTAAKDVLAVLTHQTLYLDQGQSLFRRNWRIEDEFVREHLKIFKHPAFISFSVEFAEKYAEENGETRADVWRDLSDEGSSVYDAFMASLREKLPDVVLFLETFSRFKREWGVGGASGGAGACAASPKSAGTCAASTATSGVSSMQPRKRVRTRRVI